LTRATYARSPLFPYTTLFRSEVAREGCLSIPDLTANVRRATEIVVEARSPAGERVVVESQGFEGRCILHELDHLDGILFLDRVEDRKSTRLNSSHQIISYAVF